VRTPVCCKPIPSLAVIASDQRERGNLIVFDAVKNGEIASSLRSLAMTDTEDCRSNK